jgi:hypothetical protein
MQRESTYPPTREQIAEECRRIRAYRVAMQLPVPADVGHWDWDDWDDEDE